MSGDEKPVIVEIWWDGVLSEKFKFRTSRTHFVIVKTPFPCNMHKDFDLKIDKLVINPMLICQLGLFKSCFHIVFGISFRGKLS